ncbi:MAG: class I SAM-dependent methyltransferase [candidate division Zixibacteria bacterium]|nr:class I SAM-dependent methyltransferase [candidate division Zixibacteria bacterium]
MRHVDYPFWADYIEDIFRRFRVKPGMILELACGTGNLASILATRGYRMTGVDRSAAMIAVAERKAQEAGQPILYKTGDMAMPPMSGFFDAALCLYDSANYLMDLDAMQRMFESVKRRLQPDGIFVFDVCTENNSRRYFHRQTDQETGRDFSYVRRSEYLAEPRIQVNEFRLVFRRGEERQHHFERHEQRIYPVADIENTLLASGFSLAGSFDGFTFSKASERSNRVHFVARHSEQ